ncbi:SDR family NAD(P)-dependent oxidoreductase [Halopseudomonas aestusnigri]|uniref:Short-chain dehydrogenase n=1 Tax=Halopseudomonas aestusnigri TaxID=857252 RepID=A0AAQ1G4P9_9GAMM|nr:SDR family NAD(P)-dependent oxidoreductase [Halopseudomonas aestusnigri]OWL90752.1 short-chain dehydrogenase [Halopseudomonas aestusnigri]SEF42887.1 Short-chain dehydrogenase [Halopseudomonas aestusnigri]
MNLQRRIWLTGASSGIGLALAELLAAEGHRLALTARRREPLLELAARYPGQILVITADLTDRDAIGEIAEQIDAAWGALDWAILNAGACEYMELPAFSASLVERVMQVNVLATANCIEAALPLLRRGTQPRLVAVGSSVTYLPLPRAEAYGASKAALRYLMQSLELDLVDEGIATTLVSPGFVETPMTANNDFPMPMQLTSARAAQRILIGLERGKREIRFPGPFIAILRLVAALPGWLRVALTKRKTGAASQHQETN